MKIKIGPYIDWLGPYQLAEKLCFWAKPVTDKHGFESPPEWVDNFGEWLSETWVDKACNWVYARQHRKIKIQIDKWDTWGMDGTLALIIVPMLKQLRDTTHSYPSDFSQDESDWSSQGSFKSEGFEYPEDDGFAKWKETLNEMIWAFEQLLDDDWEDQYRTGVIDFQFKEIEETDENGLRYSEMIEGPNHTCVTDWDGMKAHHKRMNKGFELFGKYYRSLWD